MPLTVEQANELLGSIFPDWINQLGLQVTGIEGDTVRFLMPAADHFMRLGGMVSGQAAMALVDTAMVVTLANALGGFRPVGTVDLSFSFMRPLRAGDVVCEVTVPKLGRSIAFCHAVLREAGNGMAAVHATGTYAVPPEAKA